MKPALERLGTPYDAAARPGKQALNAMVGQAVSIADTRRFTGSIDLDLCLAGNPAHANEPRWDYGLGFVSPGTGIRCAVWIESHNATPGDVAQVVKKLQWLKRWLGNYRAELLPMTHSAEREMGSSPYIWHAVGPVSINKGSSARRTLAQAGLSMPTKKIRLP